MGSAFGLLSVLRAEPSFNNLGWGTIYVLYPLKVQACPPRDRRLAIRTKVSGQLNNY